MRWTSPWKKLCDDDVDDSQSKSTFSLLLVYKDILQLSSCVVVFPCCMVGHQIYVVDHNGTTKITSLNYHWYMDCHTRFWSPSFGHIALEAE